MCVSVALALPLTSRLPAPSTSAGTCPPPSGGPLETALAHQHTPPLVGGAQLPGRPTPCSSTHRVVAFASPAPPTTAKKSETGVMMYNNIPSSWEILGPGPCKHPLVVCVCSSHSHGSQQTSNHSIHHYYHQFYYDLATSLSECQFWDCTVRHPTTCRRGRTGYDCSLHWQRRRHLPCRDRSAVHATNSSSSSYDFNTNFNYYYHHKPNRRMHRGRSSRTKRSYFQPEHLYSVGELGLKPAESAQTNQSEQRRHVCNSRKREAPQAPLPA